MNRILIKDIGTNSFISYTDYVTTVTSGNRKGSL